MAVKIKTETSQLDEIIKNFAEFKEKTLPILVRQHARLLAVELANRTQPFSFGGAAKNAHKLGKNAVENDIGKVFRSPTNISIDIIDKTQNEKLRTRLRDLLYAGKYKKLGEVFKSVGMINQYELISKSAFAEKHKAHRSKRSGRTYSPRKNMFIATSGLKKYTTEIQKRVGLTKSAWSQCARLIGGIKGDPARGIPAFAKSNYERHSGKIVNGINTRNPYIKMTSLIPWASRMLREEEIKFAHHIVREKMIKMAQYMTKHAAKQNFNPIPTENE